MLDHPPHIEPDWPAPASVFALSTTRQGGVSAAPWASFNLGAHVGDDPVAVVANRQRLQGLLPHAVRIQWLSQVHGASVVNASAEESIPEADGCWSRAAGAACAVMTADCLPVLLCDREGTVVAAAHAGWRGLAAGVLEASVAAMGVAGDSLLAWLGPAIGPAAFEVGAEVRQYFLTSAVSPREVEACFRPAGRPGHYLCDLYQLARLRLRSVGVEAIYGGDLCTYSESERFFSYRRDGQTGRMVSLVGLLK